MNVSNVLNPRQRLVAAANRVDEKQSTPTNELAIDSPDDPNSLYLMLNDERLKSRMRVGNQLSDMDLHFAHTTSGGDEFSNIVEAAKRFDSAERNAQDVLEIDMAMGSIKAIIKERNRLGRNHFLGRVCLSVAATVSAAAVAYFGTKGLEENITHVQQGVLIVGGAYIGGGVSTTPFTRWNIRSTTNRAAHKKAKKKTGLA